jgi:glycosyltransferase involved in cell wall biosynthesis
MASLREMSAGAHFVDPGSYVGINMVENSTAMKVSFIVTVLNETDSLRETVDTIFARAADSVQEVLIVIAPHTTASSRTVIRELVDKYGPSIRMHEQQLPFLGGALREGFAEARGDFLMLMASDLETDPTLVPQMIETMKTGQWDIVATSRWIDGGGFEGYGRLKLILNYLFQKLFRLVYRTNLTDLTFGYRLYRKAILDGIVWEELRHPFLLECLLKPLRRGARVTEVACRWRPRAEGDSANTLLRTFHYLHTAVKTRLLPVSRFCNSDPTVCGRQKAAERPGLSPRGDAQ